MQVGAGWAEQVGWAERSEAQRIGVLGIVPAMYS
jgi:hypothetical protein